MVPLGEDMVGVLPATTCVYSPLAPAPVSWRLLTDRHGSLRTVPDRPPCQGDQVSLQRPIANDGGAPFIEPDYLRQNFGAVPVRVARDRIYGETQISHPRSTIGRGKRRMVGLRQEEHGAPRLWAAMSAAKTERALRTRATAPSG